jgi:hypothetical protein
MSHKIRDIKLFFLILLGLQFVEYGRFKSINTHGFSTWEACIKARKTDKGDVQTRGRNAN